MRRSLVPVISAFALVTILLFSCTKKADYINVIPSDASVVISLDLKSIVDKSGIAGNETAKTKLTDALKSGLNAEALKYAEKIMKDPSESGISVSEKVYLFTLGEGEKQGLVAKVTDLDKVKETFKLLQNEGLCGEITDTGKNGYWMTVINEKDFCCFNESSLLLLMGLNEMNADNTRAEMERLIALTPEQGISGNKGFKVMNDKKSDIAALVTMDIIPGYYASMMKESLPEGTSLKDINIIGTINFEKGKIVAGVESFSDNAVVNKMNKQYADMLSKMGSGYLNYFPSSTLFYMGFNMNGEKFAKLLSENKEYQQALQKMQTGGVDFVKIMSSINGDVAYGISNISLQGMPSLAVYAKVSNDDIVKSINSAASGMAKSTGDNTYVLNVGMGLNMYYGIKDGMFYFTMDENTLNNLGKKVDNPMSDAKWASTAKKSYAFAVLNVKEALNIPIQGMMMGNGQEAAMIRMALSQFESVQMAALNTNSMEFEVIMAKQDENALKQLVTLGQQFN